MVHTTIADHPTQRKPPAAPAPRPIPTHIPHTYLDITCLPYLPYLSRDAVIDSATWGSLVDVMTSELGGSFTGRSGSQDLCTRLPPASTGSGSTNAPYARIDCSLLAKPAREATPVEEVSTSWGLPRTGSTTRQAQLLRFTPRAWGRHDLAVERALIGRFTPTCVGTTPNARCFNPHPARRPGATLLQRCATRRVVGVSILTRPEDRVRPDGFLSTSGMLSGFQSSPGPKTGCDHRGGRASRATAAGFNPHPARRPGATEPRSVAHREVRVSILTRPEDRVRQKVKPLAASLAMLVSILTRPEDRVRRRLAHGQAARAFCTAAARTMSLQRHSHSSTAPFTRQIAHAN